MIETQRLIDLRKLKKLLGRGDQRELARRLSAIYGKKIYPTRVSDAFYGLVPDDQFLDCLQAECEKLIAENSAAMKAAATTTTI